MNTNITFLQKTPTKILVMKKDEVVGIIWSQDEDGTLPYSEQSKPGYYSSVNSIQVCKVVRVSQMWPCAMGGKDLCVRFDEKKD
jgi:hypothetical protein